MTEKKMSKILYMFWTFATNKCLDGFDGHHPEDSHVTPNDITVKIKSKIKADV